MGMDYTPQPNFNAVAGKVKAPAIAIIVVSALGILGQLVGMVMRLVGVGMNTMPTSNMSAEQARIMNMMSGGLGVVGALLAVAIGAFIIYGGMKMMNLQSYGLALAAAIVIMIPCLSPCCCLGLPAGIWAIVVLSNAEVKAAFR
jgi:hypothetical protein